MSMFSIYAQLFKTIKRIKQKMGPGYYLCVKKTAEETRDYSFGSYGLTRYVFFDGKKVRKIDSFPDTEEYNAKYNAYIKRLKCLFSYRNIEFIKFAFFGIRPTHYDWMKEYKYSELLPKWIESQKIDENIVKIKDGIAHIIGNPTEIEIGTYELLMIDKVEMELINDNISDHSEFKINGNFMVPFSLQKYIYFNGREFCKKNNFPKKLENKYDEYIKKLKCLYGVFIRCQLYQMIGAYKIIIEGPRDGRNSMGLSDIYFRLLEAKKNIYDKMDTFGVPYLRKRLNETKNYSLRSSGVEDYVFFDGRKVRKIDNFPDSKELNDRYYQYIRELKYLFERANIEFIDYVFFGTKPTHLDWIKKYKYKKISKKFVEEYLHNEYISINKDGTMRVTGNPTRSDMREINLTMGQIAVIRLFNDSVLPYWMFKLKRNFDIPTALKEYLYFDGKKLCKKDNIPKRLERKYELYIKGLNSLYSIFIVCQIKQMIGEDSVITY